MKVQGRVITKDRNTVISTNKYYGGDVSVSYYWFYNFPNQFIWFSVWICIACVLYHMFSLFFSTVEWIRKDIPIKLKEIFVLFKKTWEWFGIFWTEELLCCLCCTGPAQRDWVHKFCVTIKKGLVVLNKPIDHFHLCRLLAWQPCLVHYL